MGVPTVMNDLGFLAKKCRRKPTNLSIREDIMSAVKALGLNASQVAERALVEALRQAAAAAWVEDNVEAIAAHNERVDRTGLYNVGLRRF